MGTFRELTRRHALALGAGAYASACAPSQRRPPDQVRIIGPWEISGLAPANSGHMFTRLQIAETLTNAAEDGSATPGLAISWTSSADRLTWRFALRPGARFHDGEAVTPDAVIHCLEAARTPPALLAQAPIVEVAPDGNAAITIRLGRPYAGLPALLAHSSCMILGSASYGADGRVERIVATGPYRITQLRPPQTIEAEVFDGHDGPAPAIARLRYLAVARAETRALMAEAGDADVTIALDPASLGRLKQSDRVRLVSAMIPRTVIVKVNAGIAGLRDVRMREALSLAIDRAGIATGLLRDPELAATQLLPPALPLWHDPTLPPLRHDPDAARAMLAEVADAPANLTLHTFPDRPELPLIATALQEQWRQIGLTVAISIGNSGDIPLGHREGTLELGLAARNYANVADPTDTLLQDFGAAGGDWGAMGWRDPGVTANLEALSQGALGAEDAAAARKAIAATLQAALPVFPITWYRQHFAVHPRVSGVTIDPLERSWRVADMALAS